VQGNRFQPRVYATGKFTAKTGRDKPDGASLNGLEATEKNSTGQRRVRM